MKPLFVLIGAAVAGFAALQVFGGADQVKNLQSSIQQGIQKIEVESGIEEYRGEATKLIGATYSTITETFQKPQEMGSDRIASILSVPERVVTSKPSTPSVSIPTKYYPSPVTYVVSGQTYNAVQDAAGQLYCGVANAVSGVFGLPPTPYNPFR